MKLGVYALFFGLFAFSDGAIAGDLEANGTPAQDQGAFFGNLHGTLGTEISSSNGRLLPLVNGGGKIAYDAGPGAFGSQIDLDYTLHDASWDSPSVAPVTGTNAEVNAAAHLTYLIDENRKLGIFAGYRALRKDYQDPNGTLSLGSSTGLTSYNTLSQSLGVGVEGLIAISDTSSLQARVALLDRYDSLITTNGGAGPVSTETFNLIPASFGYLAAIGGNHQFNQNLSARADLTYFNILPTASNDQFIMASAALQYSFDSMPLSLGIVGGLEEQSSSTGWTNTTYVGSKITYSFGGPSKGATGKLFRSGLFSTYTN